MRADTEEAVRTHLVAFAMKAFAQCNHGRQLVPRPYVRFVARHLERVADGEIKRLVVALPPRHLKTFLASVCLAAWILAHNPSAKILIVSYGQELASKIAYDIRAILQSEWYRRLFKTRLAKAKLIDIATTSGGGVRSVSIEGGAQEVRSHRLLCDPLRRVKGSQAACHWLEEGHSR